MTDKDTVELLLNGNRVLVDEGPRLDDLAKHSRDSTDEILVRILQCNLLILTGITAILKNSEENNDGREKDPVPSDVS